MRSTSGPRSDGALPLRHAVALGLLQGPTELLPVSSSAHTTLVPWLAGWRYAQLDRELRKSFEIALHAGGAVALAIHMRRELLHDVRRMSPRRAAVVALSLLPSALAGIAFEGAIERRLGGPRSIAAGLVAGGVVMAIADSRASMGGAGAARGREDAGPGDGLALGLAQAAALMPGVSRSGATRAAARARGFGRSAAQALSWHAGLPVLLGVGIARGMSLRRRGVAIEQRTAMAVGAASAFLSTRASAAFATQRGRAESSLMPYVIYRCLLTGLIVQRLRRQAAANASQTYK